MEQNEKRLRVYNLRLNVFLYQDIQQPYEKTAALIDCTLGKSEKYSLFHENETIFKQYSFSIQTEVSEVKRRHISQIYTMTPAVMKSYKNGYWRSNMDIQKYAEILQKNLEKKYKQYMGEEKTMTVNMFCINNKYPIPIPYRGKDSSKSITFLTDRVTISVGDDPASQELAYMSLGTGIGSLNARGFGFVHGA